MTNALEFEPLKDWEYEALKKDIAKRGVLVPIEYDQDDNVVDGRNRLRACEELGITSYPLVHRHYNNDEERQLTAIVLNTYRRQIVGQKRRVWWEIADQLRFDLGYEENTIAMPVKVKKPSKSDEPDALAARQREHRLKDRIKPDFPLPANADPWLVADEALDHLEFIYRHLEALGMQTVIKRLDQAVELIKQLAWGPEAEEA